MALITKYIFFLIIPFFCSPSILAQNPALTYTKGEDLQKKTSQNLFIKIVTDKTTAYEGEAIRADYYLYVAVDLQGKMSKAPSYSGFASYEINKGSTNDYQMQRINGTPFKVYPIKSVQLFGLQPGTSRIEPIKFDATVRYKLQSLGQETNQPFSSQDTLYAFEIKSEPVAISILPLPNPNNTPFKGSVGNFQIETSLNQMLIQKNQTDTFRVFVTGSGNWHNVSIPEIVFPEGIESFQPSISEWFDEKEVPLKGVKVYAYPIIGNKAGTFTIPGVSLTFFNPATQKYQTTKAQPLTLTISEKDFLAEQKKRIAFTSGADFTKTFSQWAPVLFPILALLLLVTLYRYYQKNKKS